MYTYISRPWCVVYICLINRMLLQAGLAHTLFLEYGKWKKEIVLFFLVIRTVTQCRGAAAPLYLCYCDCVEFIFFLLLRCIAVVIVDLIWAQPEG